MLLDVKLFGTDVYHLMASFVLYSILGWFVESVYMSFCNKRITNRGFSYGPFCPIYGFGATIGCLLLKFVGHSYFLVFICSAIGATFFEYLAGRMMIRFLGCLWWDYDNKPFTFQGIICLESTIGWGFYGIGAYYFLNVWLMDFVDSVPKSYMVNFCKVALCIAVIDYIIKFAMIITKRDHDSNRRASDEVRG